jgi:hypothetical protein
MFHVAAMIPDMFYATAPSRKRRQAEISAAAWWIIQMNLMDKNRRVGRVKRNPPEHRI